MDLKKYIEEREKYDSFEEYCESIPVEVRSCMGKGLKILSDRFKTIRILTDELGREPTIDEVMEYHKTHFGFNYPTEEEQRVFDKYSN